ncbi:MAG TPA: type IV secretion system protein [Sphingomonas sp.]|nr:type IV secretion system protein [Sphingomonas sp.]
MSKQPTDDLADYLRAAESWAVDRENANRSMLRLAWGAAAVMAAVALAEAVAIVALMPLKTVVPYTLLVDRQTGYVQTLRPIERDVVAPDKALTRSFLAQYVIAREGFDIDSLKEDYRKVALWSAGDARDRYVAGMQASNPKSPLATLLRRSLVEVEIRGMSSLGPDSALVRFATTRIDPGGQRQAMQPWQAIIGYRFSADAMSAADRLVNPLGFQVTRYRRDAEIPLPPEADSRSTAPAPGKMP